MSNYCACFGLLVFSIRTGRKFVLKKWKWGANINWILIEIWKVLLLCALVAMFHAVNALVSAVNETR